MRHQLSLVLASALTLGLVACGDAALDEEAAGTGTGTDASDDRGTGATGTGATGATGTGPSPELGVGASGPTSDPGTTTGTTTGTGTGTTTGAVTGTGTGTMGSGDADGGFATGGTSSGGASSAPPSDGGEPTPTPDPGPSVQPGTLTAGVWDDNQNLDRFLGYLSGLEQGSVGRLFPEATHDAAAKLFEAAPGAKLTLDISLVLDATGSMGDELSYLQAEISSISTVIQEKYPDADQRWSMVVYRDSGDAFTTKAFDFMGDLAAFQSNLNMYGPAGGGDFPEAAAEALDDMVDLSWRADASTARVAFWVADAPHHEEKTRMLTTAITAAQEKGIHIYPVASSGVDEYTEMSMRSAAQMTGGRYLFLTDDSGVGGAHKEPTIPCYFVTRLDQAMLRMIDVELTGDYREPTADEVIRTGGDPQDGACELESGTAYVF